MTAPALPLLPALTDSTRRERNDYWRAWMRSARREELYQSGYYTEPRVVGSGPVLALGPGYIPLLISAWTKPNPQKYAAPKPKQEPLEPLPVDWQRTFNVEMLILAYEVRGLSMVEACEKTGVELGSFVFDKKIPTADELRQMSKYLRFPMGFFCRPGKRMPVHHICLNDGYAS